MARKKEPVLVVREYIDSGIDLTELDLALYDWLEARHKLPKDRLHNVDRLYDTRNTKGGHWQGDAEPIPLETLEALVAEMRAADATHVEIMQHGDHNGYHAYGVRIRVGTREEAEAFAEKARAERDAALDKEIAGAEKHLADLRKAKG